MAGSLTRALSAALLACIVVAPASASDEWRCRALQTEINSTPRTQPNSRNSVQASRYAKAISAQQVQISRAKLQLSALNCSASIITFGNGAKPACAKLNGALRSMNGNMSKLKTQYARLSNSKGSTVSSRDVLRARYIAEGCDGSRPALKIRQKNDEKPRTGILAMLGDTQAKREERNRNDRKRAASTLGVPGLNFSGDTFRTLCVRKCDGYYFPISFSTTQDNFKRDTVACQTMCPGTDVQLFMHKVPEEESEDMATADGEPYKAMSYAFAYRRDGVSADPACRCQAVQGMAVLNNGLVGSAGIVTEATPAASELAIAADMVPVPMSRPDPMSNILSDRESAADAAGNFTDADIMAIFEPQIAETNTDGSIRVVGPVFLPDPSGAIELKVPVRPLLR